MNTSSDAKCRLLALTILLVSLILLASANPASSEAPKNADKKLEEIVVSATRSNTKLQQLPYAAHVIDQRQLEVSQTRNLIEALATSPGVSIQKTANGQGSPFIRGFTGYRTLALIDGVRYNNSVYRDGPNEYFALIDSASIQQIELLNGPAATLYGSDAIGGSLNLKTQASDYLSESNGYFHAQQQLRYSSAEQSTISRSQIDFGQGDSWGLLAGYSHKDFGQIKAAKLGQLPTTDYQEQAFDVRLDKTINAQWQLTALHQDLKQDDVWRSHSTIYSKSFAGTEVGSDLARLKDQQRQLSYIKLKGQELSGPVDGFTATLSRQHWREDGNRVKANGDSIEEFFDSSLWGLDLQFESGRDSLQWTYGLDVYQDQVDSGRQDSDGTVITTRIQGPVGDDARFTQAGLYLQAVAPLGQDLEFTLGSRYSIVKIDIGQFAAPDTGAATSYSDNWNNLSSSARLKYQVTPEHQLWLGLSQSFRAPNVADISRFGKSRSNELEVAALGLKPEQFLSYELGWRWHHQNWSFNANGFYTDIKDYISSTPTGNTQQGLIEVSKQNSGKGFMRGLELSAQYQINNQWQWQLNHSWARGKQELANGDRAYFSRTMPDSYNSQLQWQSDNRQYSVSLLVSHRPKATRLSPGDFADVERIPPGGTPAYTLVSLRTAWQLPDELELYANGNNLLNEAYRSHGSGTNEPGRGITVGLNWRY